MLEAVYLILVTTIITCVLWGCVSLYYKITKVDKRSRFLRKEFRVQMREFCDQIDIMEDVGIGMGKRLLELESQIESLAENQRRSQNKDGKSAAYAQAIKLVELGASVEELMESCNLSRSEAELVLVMNRNPQNTYSEVSAE